MSKQDLTSCNFNKQAVQAALITLIVAAACALILTVTNLLERTELQSINSFFEGRRWLCWSQTSLSRLKPDKLLAYHQAHEIPLVWWSWDYTLSWLIENNHPPVKHKFVIFNHTIEDEPPRQAVPFHPWMEPLLHYPTPRKTIAAAISYLAKGGARLIILDNDFPQYSADDALLADMVHQSSNGTLSGIPVPVLMAGTINHRSFANTIQLDAGTAPVGILSELSKLEPDVDVVQKYTGLTTILQDNDQVVRRILTNLPNNEGANRSSIILKALKALGYSLPPALPTELDIDFASDPNSNLYPVRPFSYLLDPQKQSAMLAQSSADVTIKGAIVLLGDGVVDVYPTPYTNSGVNLMSGSEIIANGINTVARGVWPTRLGTPMQYVYLLTCSLLAALMVFISRRLERRLTSSGLLPRSIYAGLVLLCITTSIYSSAYLLFAYANLIVPVNASALSVAAGLIAALLWEREQQRLAALDSQLKSTALQMETERQRHATEILVHKAESKERQMMEDIARRKEFVRRLNHDLKAPVTVLNWTLSRLHREGLNSVKAQDRINNITRTSDRLVDLIGELVHTYDTAIQPAAFKSCQNSTICDLSTIISECVQMHQPLAESKRGWLLLQNAGYPMLVTGSPLDIARIFDNLIRNAFIHNAEGTTVQITARTSADVHEVVIADNGKGLPLDTAAALSRFNPEPSPPQLDKQAGLGLDIVRSLLANLDGQISIATNGKASGARIIISLPSQDKTRHQGALETQRDEKYADKPEELCVELS